MKSAVRVPEYSPSVPKPIRETAAEGEAERETFYVDMDEYGVITGASYLPMLGSRVTPMIEPASAPKHGHFQINEQGIIVEGSPAIFNGRKLISHGRVSPALGRTDTVVPTCTWKSDSRGGLSCG